jgi:hypothetical protein
MNDLTAVDLYAITLVGECAESGAEDDMDEDGELNSTADLRTAVSLACDMARTIRNNPDAFMAWYVSIRPYPKGD